MEHKRGSDPKIHLLGAYQLIHTHLTKDLCEEVFGEVRQAERQRKWSLSALAEFWVAVTLDPPRALRHALARVVGQPEQKLFPHVDAHPGSFFERCQTLRPEFFSRLFERFTRSLVSEARTSYASELKPILRRFRDVLVIDGSKLEEVAHRLKLTWNHRSVLLPGCMLAVYDLFRGVLRGLRFDVDAAAPEFTRAVSWVQEGFPEVEIAADTLLVGDRLYGGVGFPAELRKKGLWGLFRRTRTVKMKKVRKLRRKRWEGGVLEEWLVDAGSGATVPVQRLRYIRYQKGKRVLELLTNILDPEWLPAEVAVRLYSYRWSVERMFYDLKEVLNVNHIYAANPNAVAIQLFAAAMVYNALRVAQAQVANQARLAPEEISPSKFYPLMAAVVATWTTKQATFEEIAEANPGRRLRKPNWDHDESTYTPLSRIRTERRNGNRRKRRYCAARRRWKALSDLLPKRPKLT